MSTKPIDKHFVSDVDKKIREFDQQHAPSEAQLAEIKKYQRVYAHRDNALDENKESDLWD